MPCKNRSFAFEILDRTEITKTTTKGFATYGSKRRMEREGERERKREREKPCICMFSPHEYIRTITRLRPR